MFNKIETDLGKDNQKNDNQKSSELLETMKDQYGPIHIGTNGTTVGIVNKEDEPQLILL